MTRKLKVLGRVRDARQKQRDASAAVASEIEAAELAAERAREEARLALDELYDQSASRLERADGVHALLELEAERHSLASYLEEARKAHDAAVARGNAARQRLRDHERALRQSEKLIEREEITIDTSERREEQRATDDFVASRWTA
jgi:flagellar biosynthesis chaperone FliJ